MVSIKIKQLDEISSSINDEDGDYVVIQPGDSFNGNSEYVTLWPDYINTGN